MANIQTIIDRVRLELGDQKKPFRQTFRGTGAQDQYDLPANRIDSATIEAWTTDPVSSDNTTLTLGADYTLDSDNGIVQTDSYVDKDVMLTVQGYSFGLFTDDELQQFASDAVLQHTAGGAEQVTRYRNSYGFIEYDRVKTTIDNLPAVEEYPVALLASILALWALAVDASTDIDLITAEGTHIPRSQRFSQLQAIIAQKQSQYETLCLTLGIGLYKIKVSTLRRVSRQTGRLVPVYVEREYDDHSLPVRVVLPIEREGADPDGPLSPAGNFYW